MRTSTLLVTTLAAMLATSAPSSAQEASRNPSYSSDVAALLNTHCVDCHHAGGMGPMSLTTYREVRPWAKSIAKAVQDGVMPPWHADPGIGHFSNDLSMEEDEIDTILRWVKRGAKEGKAEDLPKQRTFSESSWQLGEPDVVVTFDKIDLEAGGADQFFDLEGNPGLTEDTWISGVEVLPGNQKVTHHVIVWQRDDRGQQGWVGAWAAGTAPMGFPAGTGRLLKAGSPLIGDMHYHPAETAESDQTRLGLFFAEDNTVEKELINLWVQNAGFEIPPGNANFGARATFTFPQDSYITSLLPHLHYRGKDFTYTAKFPDGRKEKLLSVSKYDFNWQTVYLLEEPLYVPKGTRIDCVAHWDNSADNPNNPDPTKTVRFGNESYDEMMIGFIDYVVKDGVSPISPLEGAAAHSAELAAQYPGDVYRADVENGGDGDVIIGVLHMPRDNQDGMWYANMLGSPVEIAVTDIEWSINNFSGTIDVFGQIFAMTGSVDSETGDLSGNLMEKRNNENQAGLKGHRVPSGS